MHVCIHLHSCVEDYPACPRLRARSQYSGSFNACMNLSVERENVPRPADGWAAWAADATQPAVRTHRPPSARPAPSAHALLSLPRSVASTLPLLPECTGQPSGVACASLLGAAENSYPINSRASPSAHQLPRRHFQGVSLRQKAA